MKVLVNIYQFKSEKISQSLLVTLSRCAFILFSVTSSHFKQVCFHIVLSFFCYYLKHTKKVKYSMVLLNIPSAIFPLYMKYNHIKAVVCEILSTIFSARFNTNLTISTAEDYRATTALSFYFVLFCQRRFSHITAPLSQCISFNHFFPLRNPVFSIFNHVLHKPSHFQTTEYYSGATTLRFC